MRGWTTKRGAGHVCPGLHFSRAKHQKHQGSEETNARSNEEHDVPARYALISFC